MRVDTALPRGEFWHTQILGSMAHANSVRTAVLSETLSERLHDYLSFRHVFRHAYSFELQWSKMAPLVSGCDETFQLLERDLENFLKRAKDRKG